MLDTFFRAANSENIRTGIERVSGLPITQRSIEHWNIMYKQYAKRSAKAAGSSATLLEERLETKNNSFNSKEKEIGILEKNLKEVDGQLNQLQIEIDKRPIQAYDLLQQQLDSEKRHQKEYDDITSRLKDERREYIIDNFGRIILNDVISSAYDVLKDSEIKGETPPPIMDFFLDDLIKKHECMCGTKLSDNKKALNSLLALKERVKNSKIAQIASEGKETLVSMKELPGKDIIKEKINKIKR